MLVELLDFGEIRERGLLDVLDTGRRHVGVVDVGGRVHVAHHELLFAAAS